MKKKIKVKFVGFQHTPTVKEHMKWHLIRDILSQRYDIELSDDPDWVICSLFEKTFYSYTQYDCPRIFYCTENLTPDFSIVDYAISHSAIVLEDRHFRYPLCIHNDLRRYGRPENYAEKIAKRFIDPNDKNILRNKTYFCNFIYGFASENGIRETFFKELSEKYKQVSAAGTYLNNMPDGKSYPMIEKTAFQEKCKFTIAFESTRYSGFCTEKIIDAFYAKTIPIYFGDPGVKEIFNPEAFINVSDYKNYDEVIEVIRKMDNDDEAYMKMLSASVFNDPELPKRRYQELCEFIYHIFDQEPSRAFRRCRAFSPIEHNNNLNSYHMVHSTRLGVLLFNAIYIYNTDGVRGLWREIKRRIRNKLSRAVYIYRTYGMREIWRRLNGVTK